MMYLMLVTVIKWRISEGAGKNNFKEVSVRRASKDDDVAWLIYLLR